MEKHVNFSFSCGKPLVPTYSHIKATSAPGAASKNGSHSYEREESICARSKTQTYKKVANKFFRGMRDSERSHKGAQSPWRQKFCPASLIDGWSLSQGDDFWPRHQLKVDETLNTPASLSRCFLSTP